MPASLPLPDAPPPGEGDAAVTGEAAASPTPPRDAASTETDAPADAAAKPAPRAPRPRSPRTSSTAKSAGAKPAGRTTAKTTAGKTPARAKAAPKTTSPRTPRTTKAAAKPAPVDPGPPPPLPADLAVPPSLVIPPMPPLPPVASRLDAPVEPEPGVQTDPAVASDEATVTEAVEDAAPPAAAEGQADPAVEAEPAPVEPEPLVEAEPAAVELTAEPEPIEPVVEPEVGAQPIVEPEPVVEVEPEPELEPAVEPEPIAEPEPVVGVEPVVAPEPEVEPEPVVEPDPAPEPVAVVVEPEPVAGAEAPELLAVDADTTVPALTLRGVTKTFGDMRAVDAIDLTVPAGSFYGIVGPNGAGKTTTLSMIAGLLRPDGGTIEVSGVDARRSPAKAKRLMGVLPDRLRTFDRLTGRQLLYYYGVLRGLPAAVVESRTADLARAFDLSGALGRSVADYSAGMTKKVMLAGAMIHSPRLLVLDEPFESVDPVSSAVILDILGTYVAHGGTVILSSHGMELVERVCSRVAVLVAGQVLAEGTIDEVRGESTLGERFIELAGGLGDVEGLEWLHTFSD